MVVALRIPVLLDCCKPFPPYDNKHVPQQALSSMDLLKRSQTLLDAL